MNSLASDARSFSSGFHFWRLFLLQLLIIRKKRKNSFKYVVISGTLLVNLAISAVFFPWEKPLPFYPYFNILENDFGAAIFYSYPSLYAGMYILIEGIFGGLLANFVFVCTMYVKNQFISFGIVLLVYVGAEAIKNILFVGNLKAQEISVYGFLRGSGYVRNGWIILGEGLLFLLIQLVLVEKQVRTYEIY